MNPITTVIENGWANIIPDGKKLEEAIDELARLRKIEEAGNNIHRPTDSSCGQINNSATASKG